MDKDKEKEPNLNELRKQMEDSVLSKISNIIDASADEIKADIANSGRDKLLSVDHLFEAQKLEVLESVKEISKELNRLDNSIIIFNSNKNRFLKKDEIQQMDKEINAFSEKLVHIDLNNEELPKQDQSFQESFGLSNFVPYCFYVVAYNLINEKQYSDSADLFLLLTMLNPYVKDYWMGLGISEQENTKYDVAINSFAMCSMLDKTDPMPHVSSAQCYLNVNDRDSAERELSEANAIVGTLEHPEEWNAILDQLQSSIDNVKTKINS